MMNGSADEAGEPDGDSLTPGALVRSIPAMPPPPPAEPPRFVGWADTPSAVPYRPPFAAVPPDAPVGEAKRPRALTDAVALQNPGAKAFRWALVAILAVLALEEVLGRAFLRLGDNFRPGTAPAFLTGATLLLLIPALILLAVRVFAVGRVGLSAFGMGLRRPAAVGDAAVLGASVWFCFLLFAASWITLTTPKDELARQSDVFQGVEDTRPVFVPAPVPSSVPVPIPVPDTALDGGAPSNTEASNSEAPNTEAPGTVPDDPAVFRPTDAAPTRVTPLEDDRHVLLKALSNHPPRRVLILIMIATCLAAPIFEELFFRGFLFPAFAGRFGPIAAMLLSGALFGAAHIRVLPWKMTVPLGVMGGRTRLAGCSRHARWCRASPCTGSSTRSAPASRPASGSTPRP